MNILRLIPVSWFSSDMDIELNGEIFAHLRFGGRGNAGSILIAGSHYDVFKENWYGSSFRLQRGEEQLCRSEKPRFLGAETEFIFEGDKYTVKSRGPTIFLRNGQQIGKVASEGFFTRRLRAELPSDLNPLPCGFMLWLDVRRRKDDAASAAG